MLNLGVYSAKKYSNIRVQPTVVDRMLEIVVGVLIIVVWGVALWVYFHIGESVNAVHPLKTAGLGTLGSLVFIGSAYLPIRRIRFPVRITQQNVGIQYLLAVRITRIASIFMILLFLPLVFSAAEEHLGFSQGFCHFLTAIIGFLLALLFVVYYVLAFKYK